MNNLMRARRYIDISWTRDQEKLLDAIFERLDYLLLTCEREKNQEKIDVLHTAHQSLHDLVLGLSLKNFGVSEKS